MYASNSKAFLARVKLLALVMALLVLSGLQISAAQERGPRDVLTAATLKAPVSTRLSSLVPDDVGLLVEVENLGENAQRFLRGSFYRRFEQLQ